MLHNFSRGSCPTESQLPGSETLRQVDGHPLMVPVSSINCSSPWIRKIRDFQARPFTVSQDPLFIARLRGLEVTQAPSATTKNKSQIQMDKHISNSIWISIVLAFSVVTSEPTAAKSIRLPSEDNFRVSASCPAPDPKLYYRPVIGILSHPGDGASGRLSNTTDASCIAASYIKFVESAGARVIPLIYNEPPEILSEKLNLVNGVLFTGGWAKTGLYYEVVQEIFKKALEKNDAGDHFPVFAICLGFELLSMIISKDENILESFSATNQPSTLHFVEDANIQGTVFQRFSPELLTKLSRECLAMQNHHLGVSLKKFEENSVLSKFFKILTTSVDEDDKVYITTVKAKMYPVTGFQWHPEKNAFEWGSSAIPHTEDAIQVTQNVANYFISEARKSVNRPPARKVLDNLIYNYKPTYCGKSGKGYDEVYIFSTAAEKPS
ncbi:Gamma-glutamyl hydrolase [Acorus gramineus]|uniref:folate gamma-glutamyl hydrolase n=1 Tax=Acorus gramineus TaxID=55184 RepID=A0AAV9A1H1_ACOGR|nr:Gamma-glutamyl hydrolase [Acorus gramineus]